VPPEVSVSRQSGQANQGRWLRGGGMSLASTQLLVAQHSPKLGTADAAVLGEADARYAIRSVLLRFWLTVAATNWPKPRLFGR